MVRSKSVFTANFTLLMEALAGGVTANAGIRRLMKLAIVGTRVYLIRGLNAVSVAANSSAGGYKIPILNEVLSRARGELTCQNDEVNSK